MGWADLVVGAVAGLGGGLGGGALGAWATLKATKSTLDHEVRQSKAQRQEEALDALAEAASRCSTQLLTNLFLLKGPLQFPFIELEHRAMDELLTFGNAIPVEVAYSLDMAGSHIRRYNAAARYANDKHPVAGTGQAEQRWTEALEPINNAIAFMRGWVVSSKTSTPNRADE